MENGDFQPYSKKKNGIIIQLKQALKDGWPSGSRYVFVVEPAHLWLPGWLVGWLVVNSPREAASFLEIFDATVKALTDAGSNFSVEKSSGTPMGVCMMTFRSPPKRTTLVGTNLSSSSRHF